MKNYLIGSMVLIIVAFVLALAHTDVRRAVAEEFKDVRVINPESMPAQVRDVDNARQPVQAFSVCSTTVGGIACFGDIFTVPAGKRLVIEYASMEGALMQPGDVLRGAIRTTAGGDVLEHWLTSTPPAINSITSAGQQVRLYSDPETTVQAHGVRSSTVGHSVFSFKISGYLVDVQ